MGPIIFWLQNFRQMRNLVIFITMAESQSQNNCGPTKVSPVNSYSFGTEHAPNLARNPWGEGVKFNMAAYE